MNTNNIIGLFTLLLLIIIILLIKITSKLRNSNKSFDELLTKIEAVEPEMLDIIDNLLSDINSISNYDSLESYKNYIIETTVEKSVEYINMHYEDYDIPAKLITFIDSDILKDFIIALIEQYKYDTNIETMYNRFVDLQKPIDEESANNDIVNAVNDFYEDGTDV